MELFLGGTETSEFSTALGYDNSAFLLGSLIKLVARKYHRVVEPEG